MHHCRRAADDFCPRHQEAVTVDVSALAHHSEVEVGGV
jgi:hypothetical protein